MKLRQWIIKTFHKDKAVKVIYFGVDKRIALIWTIPENDRVTVKEKTYAIVPEKTFTHQGTPTLFVNFENAEPLDPLDFKQAVMTSDDFNTAISSKVGWDMFDATNPNKLDLSTMISLGVVVAVIYLMYTMNEQFTELQTQINDLITRLGG